MWLSLWNRSSSINIGEEKCNIQNADSEFTYTSSEISFLIELRTNAGRVICYNSKIISNKKLREFIYLRVRLKFPLSHYGMLRTDNIAWSNFYLLFLNIIKSRRRVETQNCANSSFFHNSCHWLSEKIRNIKCSIFYSCSFYIKLKAYNYQLHYNFVKVSHYLNNRNIKNYFWIYKKVI